MRVIVMRGVPGSGKTTAAMEIVKSYVAYGSYRHKIVSADAYFVRLGNGRYAFDASLLSQAHAECFKSFIEALQRKTDLVIVDNTNSTAVEMAPYMLGAAAYGYEAEYVTIHCDPIVAAARNVHGVSEQVVVSMYERMLNERMPPWWKSA